MGEHGEEIGKEAAAATQVELLVLDWFKEILGYPAQAQGILTGGGSEANLTALVVARERFRGVSAQDQRTFALSLPEMPYTYHGRIVSILWSVDVFGPSRRFWRREELLATMPIVVSPTREPFGERRT